MKGEVLCDMPPAEGEPVWVKGWGTGINIVTSDRLATNRDDQRASKISPNAVFPQDS